MPFAEFFARYSVLGDKTVSGAKEKCQSVLFQIKVFPFYYFFFFFFLFFFFLRSQKKKKKKKKKKRHTSTHTQKKAHIYTHIHKHTQTDQSEAQVGKTKVFMKVKAFQKVEERRERALRTHAINIQRAMFWRRSCTRVIDKRTLIMGKKIQKWVKMLATRDKIITEHYKDIARELVRIQKRQRDDFKKQESHDRQISNKEENDERRDLRSLHKKELKPLWAAVILNIQKLETQLRETVLEPEEEEEFKEFSPLEEESKKEAKRREKERKKREKEQKRIVRAEMEHQETAARSSVACEEEETRNKIKSIWEPVRKRLMSLASRIKKLNDKRNKKLQRYQYERELAIRKSETEAKTAIREESVLWSSFLSSQTTSYPPSDYHFTHNFHYPPDEFDAEQEEIEKLQQDLSLLGKILPQSDVDGLFNPDILSDFNVNKLYPADPSVPFPPLFLKKYPAEAILAARRHKENYLDAHKPASSYHEGWDQAISSAKRGYCTEHYTLPDPLASSLDCNNNNNNMDGGNHTETLSFTEEQLGGELIGGSRCVSHSPSGSISEYYKQLFNVPVSKDKNEQKNFFEYKNSANIQDNIHRKYSYPNSSAHLSQNEKNKPVDAYYDTSSRMVCPVSTPPVPNNNRFDVSRDNHENYSHQSSGFSAPVQDYLRKKGVTHPSQNLFQQQTSSNSSKQYNLHEENKENRLYSDVYGRAVDALASSQINNNNNDHNDYDYACDDNGSYLEAMYLQSAMNESSSTKKKTSKSKVKNDDTTIFFTQHQAEALASVGQLARQEERFYQACVPSSLINSSDPELAQISSYSDYTEYWRKTYDVSVQDRQEEARMKQLMKQHKKQEKRKKKVIAATC